MRHTQSEQNTLSTALFMLETHINLALTSTMRVHALFVKKKRRHLKTTNTCSSSAASTTSKTMTNGEIVNWHNHNFNNEP